MFSPALYRTVTINLSWRSHSVTKNSFFLRKINLVLIQLDFWGGPQLDQAFLADITGGVCMGIVDIDRVTQQLMNPMNINIASYQVFKCWSYISENVHYTLWSIVAEWLGRRTLNQRVVGANPGEGTAWYLWAGYLNSTARGSQNKQNCLRHIPLTSVKKLSSFHDVVGSKQTFLAISLM
jgi:hypothetical protein